MFYTSGRTSNEAAFLYQLLVRSFGTNNLPDCSNMCHESSGASLVESIGIGKGSVTVEDLEYADVIVIAGQNPGTNHPRMLSVLEKAKANGAKIIAINPLPEAGLMRFKDPQKVHGVVGHGIGIADEFVQIRLGGDMALFAGLGRLLLEADDAAPGTVVDRDFIAEHCANFEAYEAQTRAVDLDTVLEATGIDRAQLERVAQMLIASERTDRLLGDGPDPAPARGADDLRAHQPAADARHDRQARRGRVPGARALQRPGRPHHGHLGEDARDVPGRTGRRFGIVSPRKHGMDTVDAIRAMRDGRASVFMGMGGNFALATPDTEVTEAALRSCALTVQVSTKLNRSHVVHGRTALILPSLGRTDKDLQQGAKQQVSVEDSMSMVHLSRGSLHPPSDQVRSEVAIVCELARALLGPDHPVPWEEFRADYDPDPRRDRRGGPRLRGLQPQGPPARRLPAPPPAAGLPRIPHHHGQSQLRGQPAGVGAGARGPADAADPAQPRPVQHHHLRPRRPLPRRQGRPPGGVRQPRRHRGARPRRRRPRRPGLRVHRRHGELEERRAEGLPGRAVLDTGGQRRRLLPGDQSAGAAGPHRSQVQHPGVQGRRHPTGTAGSSRDG